MDINQMTAMMEQFKQNGGDMNAVLSLAQAMSATGKTPLGLNQWVRSDKPMMEDFNEDNRIVDEKIRELQSDLENKSDQSYVDAALANKVNKGAPMEYLFPLASGIAVVYGGYYFKTQFDVVTVSFAIRPITGVIAGNQTVGILPEGFRPIRQQGFPATALTVSSYVPGVCLVKADGNIMWGGADIPTTGSLTCFLSFIAAQ